MNASLSKFEKHLQRLNTQHQYRELTSIKGIDFTSNDFLAFSIEPKIRQAVVDSIESGTPLGAGGSRLLRGNHRAHHRLEDFASEFFQCDKSIYFANGYMANFAVLSTLPKRHDLIIFDALAHASIREGILSSFAKNVKANHNDIDEIENILKNWRNRSSPSATAWIVVESLYSMDGDFAPLADLISLVERYGAILIVDEAHATGVFGKQGNGLTEMFEGSPNLIVIHTCGKALGVSGALVCAPAVIIDYMINSARPFIFSTAPPPVNAVAVIAALQLLRDRPSIIKQLHKLIEYANQELQNRFAATGSGSQIIPFVIGDPYSTMRVAQKMQAAGFDLRAIRPPTVATGTSRLRISITLHVTQKDIANMFDTLQGITQDLKITPLDN